MLGQLPVAVVDAHQQHGADVGVGGEAGERSRDEVGVTVAGDALPLVGDRDGALDGVGDLLGGAVGGRAGGQHQQVVAHAPRPFGTRGIRSARASAPSHRHGQAVQDEVARTAPLGGGRLAPRRRRSIAAATSATVRSGSPSGRSKSSRRAAYSPHRAPTAIDRADGEARAAPRPRRAARRSPARPRPARATCDSPAGSPSGASTALHPRRGDLLAQRRGQRIEPAGRCRRPAPRRAAPRRRCASSRRTKSATASRPACTARAVPPSAWMPTKADALAARPRSAAPAGGPGSSRSRG